MGNKVKISHSTRYHYDRPVSMGPQLIRLKPAAHSRTKVLSYSLQVEPKNHFVNWIQDPYGNFQARILFPEKIKEFRVQVDLAADLTVFNPFDFFLEPNAGELPVEYESSLLQDLSMYLESPTPDPLLAQYLGKLPPLEGSTIDYLVKINQILSQDIQYRIRMEPNIQSSSRTLELGSGSCRDSALLLMEILRNQGFPARFVSGYLVQLKPDNPPLTGPSGAKEDFTDLHAWTEAYIPGAGWIGLDPTSGLLTGEGHIPLAASPRPAGAAPIEGSLDPCEVEFSYEMKVSRLKDEPRPEKPFQDPSSSKVLVELGETIDQRLDALGYTLTMGGEPTFISDTDRNEGEWNGEALGPTKKILSQKLIAALAKKWAPGGVLHTSQGKWYPGESLPRWSLSCFWRADGESIWKDPNLQAQEELNYGHGHKDAKRFIQALVDQLGVNQEFIMEAFEDPMHFLTQERNLPINVSPGDPKLANAEDRHRMIQVFHHGLDQPTGFVLPLQRGSWKSGPWPLRSGKLVLIPGDSPIGLRLPLDSLPWASDAERASWFSHDPMGYAPPMSWARGGQRKRPRVKVEALAPQKTNEQFSPQEHPPLVEGESAAWVVRSALCIQAREGKIYVFLPPARNAEDWFALIPEIEATSKATGIPVVLEGYTPQYSQEYLSFQITPDPGVIEVNLPPAESSARWAQMLEDLWEEARIIGLSSLKYTIGGQEVGSGGGCHWVLGGPSPQESPFLLRPDLLASWIRYLNRHPSLSYLFSGLFIGPTSQAPRFDEANPTLLRDLEVALKEIEHGEPTPPWLTDRIFRNLMVDGTGNTHRTELCIDKLFSPDRPGGRLGLVEFRSFEMAPHKEMALSQSLLLKALSLKFLETPETGALERHHNGLKDRWMLPYFLEMDIKEVLSDLERSGMPFPWDPFQAQNEFRFPILGEWSWEGIEVELRQALEPWPVMGEEGGGGGTVRYVDSSIERVQIMVKGLDPARYCLSCFGLRLPLIPTSKNKAEGTMICGVRFKAWKLASGLHPTLAATPKLVFDLIDLQQGEILAGFTYFVAHPAGRNYEAPPVNGFEAEARRQARFWPEGQSPGPLKELPKLVFSKEFPHTLSIHEHSRTPGN